MKLSITAVLLALLLVFTVSPNTVKADVVGSCASGSVPDPSGVCAADSYFQNLPQPGPNFYACLNWQTAQYASLGGAFLGCNGDWVIYYAPPCSGDNNTYWHFLVIYGGYDAEDATWIMGCYGS